MLALASLNFKTSHLLRFSPGWLTKNFTKIPEIKLVIPARLGHVNNTTMDFWVPLGISASTSWGESTASWAPGWLKGNVISESNGDLMKPSLRGRASATSYSTSNFGIQTSWILSTSIETYKLPLWQCKKGTHRTLQQWIQGPFDIAPSPRKSEVATSKQRQIAGVNISESHLFPLVVPFFATAPQLVTARDRKLRSIALASSWTFGPPMTTHVLEYQSSQGKPDDMLGWLVFWDRLMWCLCGSVFDGRSTTPQKTQ